AQPSSPLADAACEVLIDAVRDQELGVLRPAVRPLGLADLLLTERLPVGRARVLLVRGAVADVAVDDDQRGPVPLLLELLEGAGEELEVVGVADPGDVPAVAHEAGGDVVLVRELRVPVDRDVVVVVDPAEVVQARVPGERGGLVGAPLHEAAVAGDRVGVEVVDLAAIARLQPRARDRPYARRARVPPAASCRRPPFPPRWRCPARAAPSWSRLPT